MKNIFSKKERLYLDYSSSTPVSKEVFRTMERHLKPGLGGLFFNPNSNHESGISSRNYLEEARGKISRVLRVQSDEIIFNSGATEGSNTVIKGLVSANLKIIAKPQIITSSIEHSSILEPLKHLEKKGEIKLVILKPSKSGVIDLEDLKNNLNNETLLITLALVNGETGDITHIRDVSRIVDKWKKENKINSPYPYIHTDASQGAYLLDVSPHNLNADIVTFDGSKMYGPKGVGAMYISRKVKINPLLHGGGQEKSLRAGTQNVAGAVGLAEAFEQSFVNREKEFKRISEIKDTFISELKNKIKDFEINQIGNEAVPSIVNICFPKLDSEFAVVVLSKEGLEVSAASACEGSSGKGFSYVIAETESKDRCASSSIRFSFGKYTKVSDIKKAVKILDKVIRNIR